MTEAILSSGTRQVPIDQIAPADQTSTNSYVAVVGGDIDARTWRTLAITIKVVTYAITWEIYGANISDFSDEVIVVAGASVAAAAASSYAVSPAPYAFYRVKIKSTVGGNHGVATLRMIQKPI
jgi:hypothetical protein